MKTVQGRVHLEVISDTIPSFVTDKEGQDNSKEGTLAFKYLVV